jgi:hypothetical protein
VRPVITFDEAIEIRLIWNNKRQLEREVRFLRYEDVMVVDFYSAALTVYELTKGKFTPRPSNHPADSRSQGGKCFKTTKIHAYSRSRRIPTVGTGSKVWWMRAILPGLRMLVSSELFSSESKIIVSADYPYTNFDVLPQLMGVSFI